MPKRPAEERGGGRSSSAKLPAHRRRHHLYLVLEDWSLGYSIRKVDLSSDLDADEANGQATIDGAEQRLPPAVFRLEAPLLCSGQFLAFGTSIMFLGKLDSPWRAAPMYDVRTRSLAAAPPCRCLGIDRFFSGHFQLDGKLFVLDSKGFEMLGPPPPPQVDLRKAKVDWLWQTLPPPPYCGCVLSHAALPDEKSMVFSIKKTSMTKRSDTKTGTFAFDRARSLWTHHGSWLLPFKGRGYFDHDLDAWIGLSGDALGHLCACDVLPAEGNGDGLPPAYKLSKEKLFCVDPAEKHIGATLVQVGGRSTLCLVQCFFSLDEGEKGAWKESLLESPERLRCMLRVTTFSPIYDKHGDLRITRLRCVGSYRLPKTVIIKSLERPVAFWM